MAEQDFIKAGFTVVGSETSENKLLSFLKENYPNIIRDTEINIEELKTVLGLPIDEKSSLSIDSLLSFFLFFLLFSPSEF